MTAQRLDETTYQLYDAKDCFIETDLEQIGSIQFTAIDGRIVYGKLCKTAIIGFNLEIVDIKPTQIKIVLKNNY